MAASFAAYASQYINRQQPPAEASMLSSSHPMFFSFGTENDSRGGHGHDSALLDDYDLEDPHLNLRESGESEATARRPATFVGRRGGDDEDDDPYLRLDEDERIGRHGFQSQGRQQTAPLIAADENASLSSSSGSPNGWLAHLAASPSLHMAAPTPRPVRSPSLARSSSSDSAPPPELFGGPSSRKGEQQHHPQQPHRPPSQHQRHAPPPPRTQHDEPHSLSLTESLLPRDGRSRPLDVFSLPDPRHAPRGRRRHNDSIWTSTWLAGFTICVLSAIILLFAVTLPAGVPTNAIPYVTLLHTVPLLSILTFVSAAVAYVHIFLLQIFVKPVMVVTSVFIPITLFISALWAFIGSFMWEEGTTPTWGETVGLRLFSIIPLLLALYTGRRLLHLPQQIHTTSSTLTLTTHLLINNPFLLALSPTILFAMLLTSIPFLTLIFRLLLIGTATQIGKGTFEWHVRAWANWSIAGAIGVWLWTWGVARGTMRMTTASVIGAWYFADPSLPPPPPASTHTIHSALFRATDQSLGTTVLSALILTSIRLLTLLTIGLQRAPLYLPLRVVAIVMPAIRWAVGYIDGVTTALSRYALVYTGLTGDSFIASAKRSRALTAGVETGARIGRRRGFGKEPPLTLLTISPLVLTFPFALITYLFVAHTLKSPNEALGASVLAGAVTALVGLFCVGLVKDTADTLYLCYCIDKDTGDRRREEVFLIFEPETTGRSAQPQRQQQQNQAQQGQPVPAAPPAKGRSQQQNLQQQLPPSQQPIPYNHQQQQQQQSRRPPSFSTASAMKAPLSPFSAEAAGSRTQPLVSNDSPFSSDEDSPHERDRGGDEEVDPFKRSAVVEDEEDEMYADEIPLSRSPPRPQHQILQHQQQPQRPGGLGQSPPSHGKTPSVQVNAFISRNRGLAGSILPFSQSPPKAPVVVPVGQGAVREIGPEGRERERMMTSAELNMKSHVFQRPASGGRHVDVDDHGSSSEDEGSFRAFGVDMMSPGSSLSPSQLGLGGVVGGGGGGRGLGMEEQDVNPFEAAGDMEHGLSSGGGSKGKAREVKDMDESDLYPGSGFFN